MFGSYLIGCDNVLAKLHTSHPEACDKVGGVIIMHIDDLRKFAMLWLHKTEEVRADRAHYATNITGDIYESGWISEMYGYSFGAAEVLGYGGASILFLNLTLVTNFHTGTNITKLKIFLFSCTNSCNYGIFETRRY